MFFDLSKLKGRTCLPLLSYRDPHSLTAAVFTTAKVTRWAFFHLSIYTLQGRISNLSVPDEVDQSGLSYVTGPFGTIVDEPMALLTLAAWLQRNLPARTVVIDWIVNNLLVSEEAVQNRYSSQQRKDQTECYEISYVLFWLALFKTGRPLCEVLEFVGEVPPSWTRNPASFVSLLKVPTKEEEREREREGQGEGTFTTRPLPPLTRTRPALRVCARTHEMHSPRGESFFYFHHQGYSTMGNILLALMDVGLPNGRRIWLSIPVPSLSPDLSPNELEPTATYITTRPDLHSILARTSNVPPSSLSIIRVVPMRNPDPQELQDFHLRKREARSSTASGYVKGVYQPIALLPFDETSIRKVFEGIELGSIVPGPKEVERMVCESQYE